MRDYLVTTVIGLKIWLKNHFEDDPDFGPVMRESIRQAEESLAEYDKNHVDK